MKHIGFNHQSRETRVFERLSNGAFLERWRTPAPSNSRAFPASGARQRAFISAGDEKLNTRMTYASGKIRKLGLKLSFHEAERKLRREMCTLDRRRQRERLSPHFQFFKRINLPCGRICTSRNINNGVPALSFEVKRKNSPVWAKFLSLFHKFKGASVMTRAYCGSSFALTIRLWARRQLWENLTFINLLWWRGAAYSPVPSFKPLPSITPPIIPRPEQI